MEKYLNKYRIPSARVNWHDYNGGMYFVTICTKNRKHYFGEIVVGTSHCGVVVGMSQCGDGVVVETSHCGVSTGTGNETMRNIANQCGRLSHVISQFKSAVTKYTRQCGYEFAWQPRFHDRIIRNQGEWDRISYYIEKNVVNWRR